jgi:hypothetical protein
MKRHVLAALAASLATVLAPSLALAKGPIEATIDGPGLGSPLTFGGEWSEDAMAAHQPLMQLAEAAGFFPAVFSREPNPMLSERPKGDLGPRYVIEYRVPGPGDEEWQIVQDLYPYATPNPVTYTAPGQSVFETRSQGGWFVAAVSSGRPLEAILIEAGLPRNPPGEGDGSPIPWTLVGALVAVAAAIGLGAATVVAVRRRPHPAT